MSHSKTVFTFTMLSLLAAPAFAAPTLKDGATDADIAKILITVNEGEIDSAKIALKQAQGKDAKDLAQMMLKAHEENLKDAKAIARKNKLGTKSNDLSDEIATDAKAKNADLKKTDKKSFDAAYVDLQVKMHQDALQLIDNQLIPKVKDGEFRALLEKTHAAVTDHLDHAKKLKAKM